MQCIKTSDSNAGIQAMESRIAGALLEGKKVLWLICGGSNLPAAVRVAEAIHKNVPEDKLTNLTIAQTDERYGQPGHRDSNWTQMMEMGFNMRKFASTPVLIGKSLETTVTEYGEKIRDLMEKTVALGGLIIAQFGMGADGHIAGIFPGSSALTDPRLVSGYDAGKYIRITLTPPAIRRIQVAYAFAFGEPKRKVMQELRNQAVPLDQQPAQILKEIPESFVYSDQF